jgi:YggT family protein
MLTPLVATLLWVFNTLVQLYMYVVIVAVVASWLIAFGVLNTGNPLARSLINFLDALTEPVFRQIRRIVPPIGGIDLSPLILFIILVAIQQLINNYTIKYLLSGG